MKFFANLNLACVLIICKIFSANCQFLFPEQHECTNRSALLFRAEYLPQLTRNWIVTQVTPMKELPADIPQPEQNSCTPLTYVDSCQGAIHIIREWNNGNLISITTAYSKQFDNKAEFWESQSIIDKNYFVMYGYGTKMKLLFKEDPLVVDVPTLDIPDLVFWAQARPYAMAALSPDFEWVLYQACDAEIAWIEFDENIVKENRQQEYNDQINQILQILKIPKMEELPTDFPF